MSGWFGRLIRPRTRTALPAAPNVRPGDPDTSGASIAADEIAGDRARPRNRALAATIEDMAARRQTGSITVIAGERRAGLWVLFGRLYHAEAGGVPGDDAVVTALTWDEAAVEVRTRERLPEEHTVKAPLDELLARAAAASDA